MNNKQLKPRQVPFGWTLKRISDVARTGSGGTPLSTKKEFYNGGEIPWINSGEVGQSIIKTTNNYITGLGLKNSSAKIFPRGSVLVAMYGATAGRASLLDFDASTNQAICAIMPKKGYDAKFIKYYFDVLYHYLVGVSTGSARDNLNQNGLQDIEIPFPSESVQKSIAKVLSDLDAKIELNNKINRELEAMAKTLYDYWFVQFDFPNADGKPYKSSGGKMVYNAELKREIPEGWGVEKVSNCCKIVDCLHSKKPEFHFEAEGYYLLQLENLKDDGLIDLSNKYYISKNDYTNWTSRIEVKENDIVITNAGRVGATALIPKNLVTGIGRNITAIRPISISPTYLFLAFRGLDMKRQIAWNTDQGAFFTSLNVKGIKLLYVLRPPKDVEASFEKNVLAIRKKRELFQSQNQHLTTLRDWLLPMLMNGQVTVKQAEEKLSMAAEPSVKYGN